MFGLPIALRALDAHDFQNLMRGRQMAELWHSLCTLQLH